MREPLTARAMIRLEPTMLAQIQALAEADRRTVTDMLRLLVEEALRLRQPPLTRATPDTSRS